MSNDSQSLTFQTIAKHVKEMVQENDIRPLYSEKFLKAVVTLKTKYASIYRMQFSDELLTSVAETQLIHNFVIILVDELKYQRMMRCIDNRHLENKRLTVITDICLILKNFTCHSVDICIEMLENVEFLKTVSNVLTNLNKGHLNKSLCEEVENFLYSLVLLCLRLSLRSRSETAGTHYDGIIEAMALYIKSPDPKLQLFVLISVIYYTKVKDTEARLDENALRCLLRCVKTIDELGVEGLSKSVLIQAVYKLSRVMKFKKMMVELDFLECLKHLVQNCNDYETEKVLNIILQLSVPKENQERLKDENMDVLIGPMPTQSVTEDGQEVDPMYKHIMLSYNWDHQSMVKRIKEVLEKKDYRVWMDIEHMGADLFISMGDAVDNAWLVLVCFSKKYQASTNCQREAKYAADLQKTIIPLKMDETERCTWLGVITSGKIFHDFSDESKFDEKARELVAAIGKLEKPPNAS